jgi:hypothetical protein
MNELKKLIAEADETMARLCKILDRCEFRLAALEASKDSEAPTDPYAGHPELPLTTDTTKA